MHGLIQIMAIIPWEVNSIDTIDVIFHTNVKYHVNVWVNEEGML